MKKLLVLMLLVTMVFGTVLAGGQDEQVVEEPEEELEGEFAGKVIGFVNAGPDDYYAQFGDSLVAVANSYGMQVTELNSDYSPEQELENVQDLIAAGVDAIAVITAGAEGSAQSIKAAVDADVPIFFIAGKPATLPGYDLTGHVTDNFVIAGYTVGKWVADNHPDSTSVKIPGFLGQGTAEGQIVGYQMALEEAGMEPAHILASSEWQRTLAIPITQDLVASGREFDVIFGANEETVAGILQVFDEWGIDDKIVVSVNGKEEGWEWLREGKMHATTPNPPSLNADLSVQQMVRHFRGESFEQYLQIMPFDVLTKDNLDDAIPWDTENYMEGRANDEFMWRLEDYEEMYRDNIETFEDFDARLIEYMESQ